MLSARTLLKTWSEHASVFKWMHFRTSNLLFRKAFFISVPIIVINTVSGGLIYNTELFSNSKKNIIIFECVVGTLNMLCAILSGVRDYCRYGELGKIHEQCYQNWSRFKNEISVELISINDQEIDNFLTQMKSRYSVLISSSPNIPIYVVKKFEKEFANSDLILPDIVSINFNRNTQKISKNDIIDLDDNL